MVVTALLSILYAAMTAREWNGLPRRHRCELAPSSIQSFTRFCRNFGGWKRGDLGQSSQYGGDSSGVQHQLTNVQQICGTHHAFAAILADGSVVTWGNPYYGGDSSSLHSLCSDDGAGMEWIAAPSSLRTGTKFNTVIY